LQPYKAEALLAAARLCLQPHFRYCHSPGHCPLYASPLFPSAAACSSTPRPIKSLKSLSERVYRSLVIISFLCGSRASCFVELRGASDAVMFGTTSRRDGTRPARTTSTYYEDHLPIADSFHKLWLAEWIANLVKRPGDLLIIHSLLNDHDYLWLHA
jgi:hypothetical protein